LQLDVTVNFLCHDGVLSSCKPGHPNLPIKRFNDGRLLPSPRLPHGKPANQARGPSAGSRGC
jgi:hypothetical protein